MNVELIDFKAADGVLNNGFLVNSGSKKVVLATHGMSSNCFKERERIIAKNLKENGIDFFVYNSRGSELVKYIKKEVNGDTTKLLGGTSFEDPKDGYYDIKGAILKLIDLGYTDIYLQGHSLGSTKVVYTYNRLKKENSELLNYIKGIILLSLVNIPRVLKIYLKENYEEKVRYAKEKFENGKDLELIDFARYHDEEYNFDLLNNIDVPLFMRWGNNNEMIEESADELINKLNQKVNNEFKNISYIDGADHGYSEKEEILAKEIVDFLFNI